jgi:hypothetical protein
LFSPCTPLECRTVSRMLVFGGMARFDELAHLPFHHLGKLYGSICFLRVPLSNVAPFHGCSFSGVWLVLMNSHIYHSTIWANYMDLFVFSVYAPLRSIGSTLGVPLSNVAPFHGCSFSGVWLVLMNSHIYHSTIWANNQFFLEIYRDSIEK